MVQTKENNRPPKPGTPEYQDFFEDQAEDAMDRALAMPLVRCVVALFTITLAWFCIEVAIKALMKPRWIDVYWELGHVLIPGWMMVSLGYVALYGRVPRWMRNRRTRRSSERAASTPQHHDEQLF